MGAQSGPVGVAAFADVASGLKITGMKIFGVSFRPNSDRPYVFVKLETNQGIIGWGEGRLEGKAGAVMACINGFKDLLIGADPMQVEHIWQSMYIHSFYRAGPAIGSAISGIDQAVWDIRCKALACLFTSCSADREGAGHHLRQKGEFQGITNGWNAGRISTAPSINADASRNARTGHRHRN